MDTIKNYLDNMFARLPRTQQVAQLKENILANMEEKYYELLQGGHSENEAIGIVISEFGNIDELVKEMNFTYEEETVGANTIDQNQIEGFLKVKLENGIRIGIGVMLCILGAATVVLFEQLNSFIYIGERISLPILFSFVAIAVALFMYSGNKEEPYKFIEHGILLTPDQRMSLEHDYQTSLHSCNMTNIVGIALFILSPVGVIVADELPGNLEEYGVVLLLAMVALGVLLIIIASYVKQSYELLLGKKEDLPHQ